MSTLANWEQTDGIEVASKVNATVMSSAKYLKKKLCIYKMSIVFMITALLHMQQTKNVLNPPLSLT